MQVCTYKRTLTTFSTTNLAAQSPIEILPNDIIKAIFSKIAAEYQKNMHLVSSRFARFLNEDNYVVDFIIKNISQSSIKLNLERLMFLIEQYGDHFKILDTKQLLYGYESRKIDNACAKLMIKN
jgi:hypothetical protein